MAHNVMRRPVFHIVAVLALLAVFAAPFFHVHFAGNDERVLPAGTEARVVAEKIAADFPGGSDAPLDVFVGNASAAQVRDVSTRVAKVPGVTGVQLSDEKGTAALLTVSYAGPRTGDTAYNAVRGIRALPEQAGVQVLVGGRPAQDVDRLGTLSHGLPWMAAIMAAATFVLLFLAFGSVLLPIQAVVMNLISISASFGVIVWVFQDGHLSGLLGFTPTGFVEPTIPVLILAVLYGLATDYELFLISAVREARETGGDPRAAIAAGLQRTGRIITAAALLLVVVVGGFSSSGIVFTKMIGVGMVVAIIVDATLVRIVLLPAVLLLLGRAAWWAPGPLARLHRRAGFGESAEIPARANESHEPDLVQ
jgi:RND superfamily putative drug exporter